MENRLDALVAPSNLFANHGIATTLETVDTEAWNNHLFYAVPGSTMPGTKKGIFRTFLTCGRKMLS